MEQGVMEQGVMEQGGNGTGSNGNRKRTESLSGNPDEDNILLHSFDYIRSLPGKQVRSRLSVAFNYWLKVDAEILEKICDIVELLHNASLLYVISIFVIFVDYYFIIYFILL